jgi:hypothetical protein
MAIWMEVNVGKYNAGSVKAGGSCPPSITNTLECASNYGMSIDCDTDNILKEFHSLSNYFFESSDSTENRIISLTNFNAQFFIQ